MALGMAMSADRSVGTATQGPHRMNPTNLGDPLTLTPVTPTNLIFCFLPTIGWIVITFGII